jgi:uncharacterized protein (TIGR02099 family)
VSKSAPGRGRIRRFLVRIIALGIIGCALVISLAKLALPWLAAHPQVVEKRLSAWLHTEVKIDAVQSDWQVRAKLKIQGLHIGSQQNRGLTIASAELELDPFGFIPGRHWVQDLTMLGTQLTLIQTPAGWQLDGLGQRETVSLSNAQRLALLNSVGRLSIRNAQITVQPIVGKLSRYDKVSLALRRQGDVLQAGLEFSPGNVSSGIRTGRLTSDKTVLRAHWIEAADTLALFAETRDTRLDDVQRLVALFTAKAVTGNDGNIDALSGSLSGQAWLTLTKNLPSRGAAKLRSFDAHLRQTAQLDVKSANGQDWLGALSLGMGESAQATETPFAARLRGLDALSFVLGRNPSTAPPVAHGQTNADAALDLARLSQTAGAHLPLDQARSLAQFALAGKLTALRMQVGTSLPWRAEIQAHGLKMAPNGRVPGFSNGNVRLSADAQGAALTLTGDDFVLNAPISFRKPIKVHKIALDAALWPAAEGWAQGYCAQINDIRLSAPGYDATAFVSVEKSDAESIPEIAISLAVARGDIAYASQFWAIDKMPPKVIAWLDTALVRGATGRAKAVYRGPLKRFEFPFRSAQGRFEAAFELIDAQIKFAPDWPAISIKTGDFSLINDSLIAHSAQGAIAKNPIESLSGGIANFAEPIAHFELVGGKHTDALLALLRESPIGRDFGTHFSGLSASGGASVALKLTLPLRPDLGERTVDGVATLAATSLENTDWRLNLSGVNGQINFDRLGFSAANLAAVQNALPVTLNAAVGASHTGHANVIVDAGLSGKMQPQNLFGHEAVLAPILAKISGASEWNVRVKTLSDGASPSLTTTELLSDLVGVAIDLPQPLGKNANVKRNLRLSVPSEINAQRALVLDIDGGVRFLAELGNADRAFPKRAFRGALILGNHASVQLPKTGLRIAGNLEELNVADWAALVSSTASAAGSVNLADVSIQAARLTGPLAQFAGRVQLNATPKTDAAVGLGDVDLGKVPGNSGPNHGAQGWDVTLDSSAAAGHISWRTDLPTQTITAQFTHLHFPTRESSTTPEDTAGAIEIDPKLIPTMHLYVEDLSVGTAKLGATRWESFPTSKGMRIELLESKSADLTLTGSGDWQRKSRESDTANQSRESDTVNQSRESDTANQSRESDTADATDTNTQSISTFKLRFSAQDLGRMLGGLGFSGHVAGGQTLAEIDADWQGAPIEFALAKLRGRLKVWVGSGRFLELDPGAGRLFGLLSVRELPRRLALDFRDFFQTGMSFSEINGSFDFDAGNAYTDGLKIKAPAADITVMGRTGLSARDYDQTALVSPKIGVLPVVGALAGGPAGAAAGLIAQRVLEGERALAANYKISGSWEAPLVVKQAIARAAKTDTTTVPR